VLDEAMEIAYAVGVGAPFAAVDVPIPDGCPDLGGQGGTLPATGSDPDVTIATITAGGLFVGLGVVLRRWGRRRPA
jgi:LPXTG-motif cell wall-anchored protein